EFALDPSVELQAVTTAVAQTGVVLDAHIQVRPRSVVGVERPPEGEEPFNVLRRFDIDALLLVHRDADPKGQLRAIAVAQARTEGECGLRAQFQAQTLIRLDTPSRADVPASPRIPQVGRLHHAAIRILLVIVGLGFGQGTGDAELRSGASIDR